MKKIILLAIYVTAFSFTVSAQTKNESKNQINPIPLVMNSVLHGVPLEARSETLNFLAQLQDSATAYEFTKIIFAEAIKNNLKVSYNHSGNIIRYLLWSDSSKVKMHSTLYLVPSIGSGLNEISYLDYWKGNSALGVISWLNPKFPSSTVTLSSFDSLPEVKKYSNFVADLMLIDVSIPDRVSSRLSYNLAKKEYLEAFLRIMQTKGLQVYRSYNDTNIYILHRLKNKVRVYVIKEDNFIQPVMDARPWWTE